MIRLLAGLLLAGLLLAGCGVPTDAQPEHALGGGDSPRAVVQAFFQATNEALADPAIIEREARQVWAQRLAAFFTPGEREEQSFALRQMLANFAVSRASVPTDQAISLEIIFTDLQIAENDSGQTLVRLTDGTMRYRRVLVAENGFRTVLHDEQRPLHDVLGLREQGLPVVRIDGRWFLTER